MLRITVAIGVANATILLVQARAVIRGMYTNADYATSVVLPSLASKAAPGSVIILGNHAYYQAWWFERLTIGLPYHRQIWELSPFFVEAAGIALLCWCARAAVGRLAGLIVVVTLVSMSDALRFFLLFPAGRVELTLHAAALCAALILVRGRPGKPLLSARAAVCLACATVAFGALAATDSLTLVTVLLPFMLAPCICWLRTRSHDARRVALFALGTGALSVLIGALLVTLMQSERVTHSPYPLMFTAADHLGGSLANLMAAWAGLGGGSFFGLPVTDVNLLTLIAGVLSLAALAAVLLTVYRRARIRIRTPPWVDVANPARELYAVFFALILAFTLIPYVFTDAGSVLGASQHYLLGAWIAAVALLGILPSRRTLQVMLLVGVAIFGVITVRGHIAEGVPTIGDGPDRALSLAMYNFAHSYGARIGYAEYWDASPVTWETHFAAEVFPIGPCAPTPQALSGICQFGTGTISSWFTPRRDTPTFLITDDRTSIAGYVASPPKALGAPVAAERFGPFTVTVYPYDLAYRLG